MMKRQQFILLIFAVLFSFPAAGTAQRYEKPPKEIMDILNAQAIPVTTVSPAKDKIALLEPVRYPPIADLAEPMLRLAGLRINPNTNSNHLERYYLSVKLQNISDGKQTAVNLPSGVKLISPNWSADGKYLAAGNVTPTGVELWIIETSSGKATKIKGVQVNNAFGGFDWMPDQRSLLVNLVPANRGTAPSESGVPTTPSIQETAGTAAVIPTYQDLLKSPVDEKLFDYYTTSQLAVVGIDGKIRNLNKPAIFDTAEVSPDGKYVLTSRIVRPYTYLFPFRSFPNEVEVWDTAKGDLVYKVASIPIRNNLPNGGVTTSPRSFDWIPTEASTLMWVEALDGGDPKNKVEHRDKLIVHQVPTRMAPREILKTEERYAGRIFGENNGMMWYYDYDRDKQRRRIFMTDYRDPKESKLVSDLNVRDRYNDIGSPETKTLPNGKRVVIQNGDTVYLSGSGATPQGDRPFLSKMDLKTLKRDELFRSGTDEYETFVELMDENANAFITRRESETEPPNLYLRDRTNTPEAAANATSMKPITNFKDPTPQLSGITKKLIKYKRKDGVDLSFTLYLPPNYKEGTKLPTLLWAYPLEYTNNAVAGQVSGSTNRFTQIGGTSHLFLLLSGYAILNDATVPIVGDPLTVNDTFIQQLVDGAQAAIDKGVEMGVVDRDRVAVGGHSYGAFMTAHLLANSDMFRAGIARSGAYNRTLTPFGFQSERRTFWEAPESYYTLSPFMRANKINEPMLMIHGQADNNSGTYPMQSERMFAAIQGNGGTARLVMLPLESHGYSARESIEHVLWEQLTWMDKHVKNAKPRNAAK
ncbi:MAG: prolyl oligopeptidase family serine peptidase [Pyrinomonadaceae bacterium]